MTILAQVTIQAPRKGNYVLRVDGADVPLSPQAFALVVTGSFTLSPESCPSVAKCPQACSGHGACVAGRCKCDARHVGADCGEAVEKVGCGQNYTAEVGNDDARNKHGFAITEKAAVGSSYALMIHRNDNDLFSSSALSRSVLQVPPLGWNYYVLDLPSAAWAWELDLQWPTGMELAFFAAFNRQPTESDYDLGNTSSNSSFEVVACDFSCAADNFHRVCMRHCGPAMPNQTMMMTLENWDA